MKKLVFAVIVGMCAVALADSAGAPVKGRKLTPEQKAEMKRIREAREYDRLVKYGGRVRDVREQHGRLAIVNAQEDAKAEWIDPVAATFEKDYQISVVVTNGTFKLAKPEMAGEATLFIVDDPALPISLHAPEAHWAMMNVAPMKSDKTAFYEQRVQKFISRNLCLLLGAADSQYPMCLTTSMSKVEDIDKMMDYLLPMDVMMRIRKNVAAIGIVPYKIVWYRTSVEQGWGAQPTNDIQKAIWDEVHTLPSDPIKIKYDPKRDK